MINDQWLVYWNEYTSNTYTYGSKLRFISRQEVAYENALMPPGTVINSWYSRTNFQRDRIEPSLPIIDGEGAYHISVNMDFDEGSDEDIMLRIIFFDRYDEKAESIILRGRDNYFKPSIQTHSYRIELINGGIHRFVFHSIILKEVSQEEFHAEQDRIEKLKEASKKGKTLRRKNKKARG